MHQNQKGTILAIALAVGLFAVGNVRADIIGPGDVKAGAFDVTGPGLFAVDLMTTAALAAGTYDAASFNYQFFNPSAGPAPSLAPVIGGSITPMVLTGGGGSFTPVAIGNTVTYAGPTSFLSTTFGGSSQFTLAAATTVYAGFIWSNDGVAGGVPIGYDSTSGSAFVVSGVVNPPVIGAPVSAGFSSSGTFARSYDFSININAAAVPSPSSVALVGIACVPLLARRRHESQTQK